jgi:hypothetical protein
MYILSFRCIAVRTNMTRQKKYRAKTKYEKFYFVRSPVKIDKCPTNFWLGQTFVLPSKIIICKPAWYSHLKFQLLILYIK